MGPVRRLCTSSWCQRWWRTDRWRGGRERLLTVRCLTGWVVYISQHPQATYWHVSLFVYFTFCDEICRGHMTLWKWYPPPATYPWYWWPSESGVIYVRLLGYMQYAFLADSFYISWMPLRWADGRFYFFSELLQYHASYHMYHFLRGVLTWCHLSLGESTYEAVNVSYLTGTLSQCCLDVVSNIISSYYYLWLQWCIGLNGLSPWIYFALQGWCDLMSEP